ncbi:retrovirus-related pol polyprotein from transposon RE1 [Tanacetum coccineum]
MVAFNTTSSHAANDSSSSRGRGRSYSRGSSNRGRGRGNRRPPHCQLSRKDSHYANRCPDLHTFARHPSSLDANLAEAFQAQCNTSAPDWFVDTGASAHMTSDSAHLDAAASYSGNDFVIFGMMRHSKETLAQGRRRKGLYALEQGQQAFLAKLSSKRIQARVYTTRHAQFDETSFPFKGHQSTASSGMILLSTYCDDYPMSISPSTPLPPSTTSHPPAHTPPCELGTDPPPHAPSIASRHITDHPAPRLHCPASALHQALFTTKEPKGFKSAAKDPKWFAAMCDEMKALKLNATWELVPRPTKSNIVPGPDYSSTFSLIVKASTVRIILSLAVLNKWPLHKLDVKNAFLNGNLSDIVYMNQLPRELMTRVSLITPDLLVASDSNVLYLLVYVDDIILTGNNANLIRLFISRLNKEFLITDLGKLNYFLGLEVSYNDSGIFLSQSKYAHDILARAHLLDAKPATTPLSTSAYFMSQGTPFNDPTLYRSLVGAL